MSGGRRHGTVRCRGWVGVGLAVATAVLAVVTLLRHDWIEVLFAVDPDGGGGELEWLLTAALAVLAVAFTLAARVEFRRAATSEPPA